MSRRKTPQKISSNQELRILCKLQHCWLKIDNNHIWIVLNPLVRRDFLFFFPIFVAMVVGCSRVACVCGVQWLWCIFVFFFSCLPSLLSYISWQLLFLVFFWSFQHEFGLILSGLVHSLFSSFVLTQKRRNSCEKYLTEKSLNLKKKNWNLCYAFNSFDQII